MVYSKFICSCVSLQSAVGYEYEGKTDAHASQKGELIGYHHSQKN